MYDIIPCPLHVPWLTCCNTCWENNTSGNWPVDGTETRTWRVTTRTS